MPSRRGLPLPRRCGARSKRTRGRCGRWATPGKDKCKWHGGATPIKHGLRSKYGPPPEIAERIAAFERDPRVLDHRHIAAHLYAVLTRLLEQAGERGLAAEDASALVTVLRELRRVTTDHTRLAIGTRYVDLVEAEELISRAIGTVLDFVPQERQVQALAAARSVVLTNDRETATLAPTATDSLARRTDLGSDCREVGGDERG